MGEPGLTGQETAMRADVTKRVQAWKDMLPFYSDAVYGQGKEIESRNAEAVLNAIIPSGNSIRQPGVAGERTLKRSGHCAALNLLPALPMMLV